MAKRFTDSRKWDDPWFTELANTEKLTWIFLLDKCDHCGFFKPNMKLLNFQLNTSYTQEDLLGIFKDRVIPTRPDKWFIPKFIRFQYGELNTESRVHTAIINTLRKEDVLTECQQSVNTPKDKDKEQDKEKNKDIDNKIRNEYIRIKEWNSAKLTSDDYGRMGKAIKNLLIKASGNQGLVIEGLTWLSKQRYEWTIETLIKKWPDFMKYADKPEIVKQFGGSNASYN